MADELHILRNPHGHSADEVREARLWAADEIERLSSVANRGGHLKVANDEIERLSAENEVQHTRADWWRGRFSEELAVKQELRAAYDDLRAEVERHTQHIALLQINLKDSITENDGLRAEVERMTAGPNFEEIEDILRSQLAVALRERDALTAELAEANATIETLRGDLQIAQLRLRARVCTECPNK